MSKLQETELIHYPLDAMFEKGADAYYANNRQLSLMCAPHDMIKKNIFEYAINNINICAPKIKACIDELKKTGKHVIYSSFVEHGVNIVAGLLEKKGWKNLKDVDDSNKYKYKVFAIWDGKTEDVQKQNIKNIVNNINNINGKFLRVVIGSPSIREGISFKHMQHIHILDPVWNYSAMTQIEGRVIRFCSHVDISPNHSSLKRNVVIHQYVLMPRENGNLNNTVDMLIYDKIIPKKKNAVIACENALKKVAIDYFLFRRLYENVIKRTPIHTPASSDIELNDNPKFPKAKKNYLKKCPPLRRPDEKTKECLSGFEIKEEDGCCYKRKGVKLAKSTCPPIQRPDYITNKCLTGYEVKNNKHDDPCCYKIRNY
jgi:hypothetical protein